VAAPAAAAKAGSTLDPSAREPRHRAFRRLLYPDPGILWAIRAAPGARRLGGRVQAVLTSAPPFSTHLIGLFLRSGV
jgi:hypothetical protein